MSSTQLAQVLFGVACLCCGLLVAQLGIVSLALAANPGVLFQTTASLALLIGAGLLLFGFVNIFRALASRRVPRERQADWSGAVAILPPSVLTLMRWASARVMSGRSKDAAHRRQSPRSPPGS